MINLYLDNHHSTVFWYLNTCQFYAFKFEIFMNLSKRREFGFEKTDLTDWKISAISKANSYLHFISIVSIYKYFELKKQNRNFI